jgi:hypothetical protein
MEAAEAIWTSYFLAPLPCRSLAFAKLAFTVSMLDALKVEWGYIVFLLATEP